MSEEKTIKTAIENMNTYLDECHYDDDAVTITAKVLRSIRDNYCDLLKYKVAIERLKEGIKFERERVDNIPNLLLQAKSEAIREFAKRFKNLTASYWFDNINKGHIDNLVKEMVGDSDER